MTESLVAAVQMVSGDDLPGNLARAAQLIECAVDQGARLVVLPENFAFMGASETDKLAIREPSGSGPIQEFLARQARTHAIWLVGGTIPLDAGTPARVRAACILFNDQGEPVARYDKIHLFDVSVAGKNVEHYAESETVEPGNRVVVAETPCGRVGLAVCYDLRFPELFRAMVVRNMELLALPAAFTATTGAAHWETLLRARAIENLCYVVAAAQGGRHPGARETHGDSMIVDPWGHVLTRLSNGANVAVQAIDRGRVRALRESFPAINHIRMGFIKT